MLTRILAVVAFAAAVVLSAAVVCLGAIVMRIRKAVTRG